MITAILVATAPRWGEMGTHTVWIERKGQWPFQSEVFNNKLYYYWYKYRYLDFYNELGGKSMYLAFVTTYSLIAVLFAIASSYSIYKTIKLFKR
ncbi:hypothetical protein KQ878_00255 [Mycoplasma zalophidermidis]|uniref:Uncharacterized protein n=1 Tax=Mycoplasma zalophidermidis TaxID=398174 RepID=A0ABS6DS48_9MOLU|nr:hypothetical protein [Mycoplasma zalophidermidis]MBU4693318.1 hypothetical protein [Mycoplasma zalophidermidis]